MKTTKWLLVLVCAGVVDKITYTHVGGINRRIRDICKDCGYSPAEINESDKFDLSLWKLVNGKWVRVTWDTNKDGVIEYGNS